MDADGLGKSPSSLSPNRGRLSWMYTLEPKTPSWSEGGRHPQHVPQKRGRLLSAAPTPSNSIEATAQARDRWSLTHRAM